MCCTSHHAPPFFASPFSFLFLNTQKYKSTQKKTDEVLVGCTVYGLDIGWVGSNSGYSTSFHGSFAGPDDQISSEHNFQWTVGQEYETQNRCTAVNLGGDGVYAQATCCESSNDLVVLSCRMAWGPKSGDQDDDQSVATCPYADEFLTGVSAF